MGSESSCAAQQNKCGLPKIDHVNCCMLGWSENDSYIPKTASLKKGKKMINHGFEGSLFSHKPIYHMSDGSMVVIPSSFY